MRARSPDDRWFVARPPAGPRLRLFCLPFAGGGTGAYRDWQAALGPQIEVCAVRLPGRESRIGETPYRSLPELVDALTEPISRRLDLPFAIFGHSMGAFLGFELTRRLRRRNARLPLHFIASARFAPQLPDPDPPIHHLPHDEFLDELRRLEGTPPEVFESPELLELMIPMLRADFEVCETYQFESAAPLDCPLSVYGGIGDWTTTREQLDGWGEQTTGAFTVRMFPGDHFFIQSARMQVLETLRRELTPYVVG